MEGEGQVQSVEVQDVELLLPMLLGALHSLDKRHYNGCSQSGCAWRGEGGLRSTCSLIPRHSFINGFERA